MLEKQMVNIINLDKAAVLAALYNRAVLAPMGLFQAHNGPETMTVDQAKTVIEGGGSTDPGSVRGSLRYDYLFGRPLKVDISGDEFNPLKYDRDNGGEGTAQSLIAQLRYRTEAERPGNPTDRTTITRAMLELPYEEMP